VKSRLISCTRLTLYLRRWSSRPAFSARVP